MFSDILYKVVNKDFFSPTITEEYYSINYRDLIIKARPNTMGLFLFDTYEHALIWGQNIQCSFNILTIKPVKNVMEEPSWQCADNVPFYTFYGMNRGIGYWPKAFVKKPPNGTLCCHAIKVIDVFTHPVI